MRTAHYVSPTNKPGKGAVLQDSGCVFRVWAPFADRVALFGDFFHAGNLVPIDWDEVPMARDAAGDTWSVFVSGVVADSLYKFRIGNNGLGPGSHGADAWKNDPYARDATGVGGNAVVVDRQFDWSGDAFETPDFNDLVIYELHIGTFNHEAGQAVGTFSDAINRLDYVASLGVSALQVMPAFDFDTETSMGYNVALPFAVDNAYGRVGAMKEFVKAAHLRGMAAILDVVYNHWGPEGLDQCLGKFDGYFQPGTQGIYFYDDIRRFTGWGDDNRPDYGRGEVRSFIRDNAMTCLGELRFDGLRLDSTINIRRAIGRLGDNGANDDGFTLLRYLGEEKRKALPRKILIAEDLQSDPVVTRRVEDGGIGLDAQWDTGFLSRVRSVLLAASDESRLASSIAEAVGNCYSTQGVFERLIYVESHDETNGRRITDCVAPGDADGWLARKISALGAGILLTTAGIPMLFMGQEFLDWKPWSDGKGYGLEFDRINRFGGFVNLYRRLIQLRRNWDNNTRGLKGAHTHVFHASDREGVVAYHRWSEGGPGDDVVVVANLRNQVYPSYNVGFPREGTWHLRFNGDDRRYCDDFGAAGYSTRAEPIPNQKMPCSGNVGLGPYSVAIYSQ